MSETPGPVTPLVSLRLHIAIEAMARAAHDAEKVPEDEFVSYCKARLEPYLALAHMAKACVDAWDAAIAPPAEPLLVPPGTKVIQP